MFRKPCEKKMELLQNSSAERTAAVVLDTADLVFSDDYHNSNYFISFVAIL